VTSEERSILEKDLEIYKIQEGNIMRDIRPSRGGFMVRQLVEQLNALQMVIDRLEGKLKTAKVTTKAKK
jgi:hypothetical protein|tara:strand:+ start:3370 stop:3576 length:207 start_codon:yes stop_codon:yes gene_type:complete